MLNQPLRRLIEQDKTVTVPPQTTVHDVAWLMLERAVGAVMVVDNGVLTGIFSERDVVFRVVARGLDARTVLVRRS